MITVYIWSNNLVGHAALWVSDEALGDQYLSFHPTGFDPLSIASERDLLSNSQFEGYFSEDFDEDVEKYGTRYTSYAVHSADKVKVQAAIISLKLSKPKYEFYTFNCSDAVIYSLQYGIEEDDDQYSLISSAKGAWERLFPSEARGASLADGLSQSIMQNITKVTAAASTKGPIVRKATAIAVALATLNNTSITSPADVARFVQKLGD